MFARDLDGERGEHDRRPDEHIRDEVVGRRHDGEDHRRGQHDGARPEQLVARGLEDDDAQYEVPAGVEARHGRELVDERRREDLPVPVRVPRDGVDQRQVRQPRRRHGEQREDDEPDEPAEQAHVAQPVVVGPPVAEEEHACADEHRPVAVDVNRVGGIHEHVAADHKGLDGALPVDAEARLEPQHLSGVRHGSPRSALRQRAHAEVDAIGEREDRELAPCSAARAKAGNRACVHDDTLAQRRVAHIP